MAEIQVTTATLKSQKDKLKGLNSKFNSQLGKMDSTERELTAMWEGDASTAFHKSYTTDTQKMEELYKAVEQYCQALDDIIKKYETTELKNKSIAEKRTY